MKKKSSSLLSNGEVAAEIRNKLQAAKTALELIKAGKKVPTKLIDIAIKDLEKVLDIIN